MNKRFEDITGQKFGKLTALTRNEGSRKNLATWTCQCECGKTTKVQTYLLKTGWTESCGCLRGQASITHGKTKTPEYKTWVKMRERCLGTSNERDARNYKERGISICKRWVDDFQNFFDDMGVRPSPKHSIERLDVNGNYEPSNCIWATTDVQKLNRRNTLKVTVEGELIPLFTVCENYGFNYGLINQRRYHRKITLQEAFDSVVSELFKKPK